MDERKQDQKGKRRGNYKPGPGRPPGRKNNKTLALENAAQKALAAIDSAFDGDAHAFLQAVYKNPDVPLEVRIMAAGRALRVEKPVLSASRSEVQVNLNVAERLQAARLRVTKALGPNRFAQIEGRAALAEGAIDPQADN